MKPYIAVVSHQDNIVTKYKDFDTEVASKNRKGLVEWDSF